MSKNIPVALFVSAWIETVASSFLGCLPVVALFVSAWIETETTLSSPSAGTWSHSS